MTAISHEPGRGCLYGGNIRLASGNGCHQQLVTEVRYFYLRITRTVLYVMKLTSFPLAEWRNALYICVLKIFCLAA